jgi:peptide/nickel transport system permease protein
MSVVLAVNLLGDHWRDRLDVRHAPTRKKRTSESHV